MPAIRPRSEIISIPDPSRGLPRITNSVTRTALRFLGRAALAASFSALISFQALAQAPQLVFTAAVPAQTATPTAPESSAVVEERGLALWGGTASDFGIGVAVSGSGWTVRGVTSMTSLSVDAYSRPTFQQIEVVRPLLSRASFSLAGGGGVREEWDGTRVIVGRVLARSETGRGGLQGSVVMEHALSSPARRDPADLVTSLAWSRRVGRRISLGVEGIGQDIEGLWNAAEADGGAKLLVGPSFHAQSASGRWAANLTAGPVVQTLSTAVPLPSGGHHFGIFVSGSWMPSLGR